MKAAPALRTSARAAQLAEGVASGSGAQTTKRLSSLLAFALSQKAAPSPSPAATPGQLLTSLARALRRASSSLAPPPYWVKSLLLPASLHRVGNQYAVSSLR